MFGVLLRTLAVAEVRQDAFDYCRVFDHGNHFHPTATGFASLKVDLEHPLQALCLTLIAARGLAEGSAVLAA